MKETKNKEIEILKERLKAAENERDDTKASLHVVTLHCVNLIAKKDNISVEDVYNQINNNLKHLNKNTLN
jgi:flagellar motility protein MotE (MotC chaperone)